MGKIRTLIVDDEPVARRGIRLELRGETDIDIIGECSDGREAVSAVREQTPDLVFLDVQMPGLDGFGVIQEIGFEQMPAVIFVTAYDQYALRAFDVHAVDYLLKPIDSERFREALRRVRLQIQNQTLGSLTQQLKALLQYNAQQKGTEKQKLVERFVVRSAGRIAFLNVEEIDWIESDGNYVRLHAGRETHFLRETMNGMEGKLDAGRFLRIRRSTLVNIERVKELRPLFGGEYVMTLRDGTRLTTSRRYRKNLDLLLKQ